MNCECEGLLLFQKRRVFDGVSEAMFGMGLFRAFEKILEESGPR